MEADCLGEVTLSEAHWKAVGVVAKQRASEAVVKLGRECRK